MVQTDRAGAPAEPGAGTAEAPAAPLPPDEQGRTRVTIADIARKAGVSAPTVSKVLNGHSQVSAATRQKVEALLESHNYLRRRPARQARPARGAGLIDLVVNELDSPWSVEVIRGVEETAARHRTGVVVSAVHSRSADTLRWLDNVTRRGTDGVILAVTALPPGQRRKLAELDTPLVVVDPVGNPDPDIPSIGATNWHGGLTATRHLLGLGHTRIGILTGPAEVLCSRARVDGYRAALEGAGLRPDPALVRAGDFHHETGFAGARDLLALPDPPTALFACSDLQALGAYEAVRRAGLQVGRDVSVVGFDDLPTAAWASPPLTSVRQPLSEMASMAARIVLQDADAVLPGGTQRLELATDLVVRESTAPPQRGGRAARRA